jgi:hypothetical protein
LDLSGAGWPAANELFEPSGSFLDDEDIAMDWLYKGRALIGVAILVVVGIHYHQKTSSWISKFDPVLGGVTEPMVLALLSVIPATAAVYFFTRPQSRAEAFRQMMRYPVKVALTCLGAFAGYFLLAALFIADPIPAYVIYFGIGLVWLFKFFLFPFRAVYLVTVGTCRLGDGHPLLPPVVGTILAWVVACQSMLTGQYGTGGPAVVSFAVLLGGPLSITALGLLEISRLANRYPDDFPFRDGPVSPLGSTAQWPPAGPAQPAGRYQLSLVLVGVVGVGVVGVGYAAQRPAAPAPPAAVSTSVSALQSGQCIQSQPAPNMMIDSLPVISCSAMHWGQVLGLISIGDPASTTYPGDTAVQQLASTACNESLHAAVGSNSRYVAWSSPPSQDAWENNQWANALCIAEADDGTPFQGGLSQ